MAFTTTSNFSGKAAGFYISQALQSAVSLDYMTMIENIKFKSNIQALNQTVNSVVDATCDFTAAGTLALTEKVLEPKNLQINPYFKKTHFHPGFRLKCSHLFKK